MVARLVPASAGGVSLRGLLVLSLAAPLAGGCRPDPPNMRLVLPARLAQVSDLLEDLSATAQAVPEGGEPLPEVELTRGDDGTSFSGFIEAEPGTYVLEIVFRGTHQGAAGLFLGRLTSDPFVVASGQGARPPFHRPLDPIGREGDGGDPDGDGLGILDEILWGLDSSEPDTDGDGVPDGEDCAPADGEVAIARAPGGSLEDCDGDGVRRRDLPWGGGTDCDDYDPTVTVCGPEITDITPAQGARVGCDVDIAATIVDPEGVALAEVRFFDPEGGAPQVRALQAAGGDRWQGPSFQDADLPFVYPPGDITFEVSAQDTAGARTTERVTVQQAFAQPTVTLTSPPASVVTEPFTITVGAAGSDPIASVRLFAAPHPSPGCIDEVCRSQEVEITDRVGDTFTIDPAALPPGAYVLYAEVADEIGNRVAPTDSFSVEGDPGDEAAEAHYDCDPHAPPVPVRRFRTSTVEAPGFEPATMRDLIDEAVAAAALEDPGAVLVEVLGWGIESDGTIDLGALGPDDFKKWAFTFFDFDDDTRVEVSWWAAAEACDPAPDCVPNPVVEVTLEDPFGFSFRPFDDVGALVDSDVAVGAYAAAGCTPLTGHQDDTIRYESNTFDGDIVRIYAGEAPEWQGTATPPVTEVSACQ